MSKKHRKPKFTETWVTQTDLGKPFKMSARKIGQVLVELGLRQYDEAQQQYVPTQRALDEGFCTSTPLKDGTPFYMWNKRKVAAMIEQQTQVTPLRGKAIEYYETALDLVRLAKDADATGFDKLYHLYLDDISPKDYAGLNEQLAKLGSDIHLGRDEPEK